MTEREFIAKRFHEVYEDLAPDYGYRTRSESRLPWDEVSGTLRSLMVATVGQLLKEGTIAEGDFAYSSTQPDA